MIALTISVRTAAVQWLRTLGPGSGWGTLMAARLTCTTSASHGQAQGGRHQLGHRQKPDGAKLNHADPW
eukprot:CAMPEP_0179146278 /NCGR_PEP_ID=MMETSP0796-20121207/70624_1 /TAXON_ID=73915 /ORGANISM="Pyrodinium bahamense, Strain pbaha01" /LENGTH=68 /DNA_ID=CAMNT_0020846737 /DNA_START=78 /DNA_END=281 /DNA_ORIENTATION=+